MSISWLLSSSIASKVSRSMRTSRLTSRMTTFEGPMRVCLRCWPLAWWIFFFFRPPPGPCLARGFRTFLTPLGRVGRRVGVPSAVDARV